MTEALPHTSTEQNTPPEEAHHNIGSAAVHGARHEADQPVSIGDLIRHDSAHIYEEFIPFARRSKFEAEQTLQKARAQNRNIDFELEKHLMMPKIVYKFIRKKSEDFIEKRGEHPIVSNMRGPLPEKMIMANLRQLHDDKAKGRKHNQGAHLAKQEAFEKIATDLKDYYPDVYFAMTLRSAFEANDDLKYASYATDIINVSGRTLYILGKLHQAQTVYEEGTVATDGV